MKRLVSGFFGARSIASTMLVLGLVLGVLVTPQPAGALDQSTTGQSTSRTVASSAARVNTVSAQVASLVARSVSNVLLRDVVAATMGLFNTKTPAGFVTRLTTPTAGDISTTTEVDNKMGYLPGDSVTITSTVSVTGNEAKSVSVYVFLPSEEEGFIHTGELKPQCMATGKAKCPIDDKWTYDDIIGYFTTVVDSIPAGGGLVFKITGQAGLQSKPQNTDRILTGAFATPVQDANTMDQIVYPMNQDGDQGNSGYSGDSFKVREEKATVTGVFDLTESEESGTGGVSVTVTGTLKCTVPGRDGDYINSQFTHVLQSPGDNTKQQLSEGVYKGSTCTVTVDKVEVPADWEWAPTTDPVRQRVTENTEVQVAVDALPPAPEQETVPEQELPAPVEPVAPETPMQPAPESMPVPSAPEQESEPAPSPVPPMPEPVLPVMPAVPETPLPSEPEQELAPEPAPEPEPMLEPAPAPAPVPAPVVPVVPEAPVTPDTPVVPVPVPAETPVGDSVTTGGRVLANTGAGWIVAPFVGGVFALLGASVVIATARRRSSRA
ncbi:hypothetical protein KJY77_06525 [Canibacter sp. lx-72]|uniref:hypothetical protein n=1 Tax=Canibacter zhuwentaonis TaxID=2837491 RepID=UPI001BDBF8D3|nr:hypothetical protein [Canibacter zhuwentaonis]MBT1018785.1 hypothetical protein [Canibacter zhuwentaonis]